MNEAYVRIFDAIGLDYRAVEADSGSIGGAKSREFHVLADSGEDALVYSTGSDYAANMEKARAISRDRARRPRRGARRARHPRGAHDRRARGVREGGRRRAA